jgi:hypothetical protein
MDITNEVENKKFLGVFGRPFMQICYILTLKSGVIIVAAIDIFLAVVGLMALISFLFEMSYYTRIFISLVDIACAPLAIFGIIGITKIDPEYVAMYTRYKIVELFVVTLLLYTEAIENNVRGTSGIIVLMILASIKRIIAGFLVKIVWSADVRLRYNQTDLVIYGQTALQNSPKLRISYEDPRVIVPDYPIYALPPY